MAKISAKGAIILVGGYNLSTYFTSYEIMEGVPPIDVTGFTDGCQNFIPGIFQATISGSALWDNTTDTSYPVLKAGAGNTTNNHVTILPEGGTAGNPSISLQVTEGGITPTGSPGAAIGLGTIQFSSLGVNEGVENGTLLHYGAVTDSTTDTGILDVANAAVTARCAGTLHIYTACASDTYEVKIQHSSDDITYDDLVTFTLNGSALGSERVAVASGVINKYRRVLATRTGIAGDSFGFAVHFWRENYL